MQKLSSKYRFTIGLLIALAFMSMSSPALAQKLGAWNTTKKVNDLITAAGDSARIAGSLALGVLQSVDSLDVGGATRDSVFTATSGHFTGGLKVDGKITGSAVSILPIYRSRTKQRKL